MGKRTIELPTFNCTYCNYEAVQLTQVKGQDGAERFICGDCMIKAFDAGLNYDPNDKPAVSKPLPEGPAANPEPPKQ